ncbi:hypothetical protein AURDEDRAFT_183674 [Auricularia subglabra TFB-10046 SS5]|nr:hypothetical protein AURDEDRAFT_183674 [Auricularia subglabra TFB-10046 SS5]
MAPRPFTNVGENDARSDVYARAQDPSAAGTGLPAAPEGYVWETLSPTYSTYVTVVPTILVYEKKVEKRAPQFAEDPAQVGGTPFGSTLATDPEVATALSPSRTAVRAPIKTSSGGAQTTLATAAISAALAVGALALLAGAGYMVYFLRKRRSKRTPKWNMVGSSINISSISAPMPIHSAGPYSHLSEISMVPRPAPTRKPVPTYVIGDDEEKGSTDSHSTVRIVKTVVQEVHRSMRPQPAPSYESPATPDGITPTQQYFDQRPLQVINGDKRDSVASMKGKPAPLQSAPAGSSVYNQRDTILDEPSPFIQTAPLVPVVNPFADPLPPVPSFMPPPPPAKDLAPPQTAETGNPFNRFSMAATLTAVSTAGFFPTIDVPAYDNRSPVSLPASAIGSAETPTRRSPATGPMIDQFPMPPSSHSMRSNGSGSSGRSRASRPAVPLRISTFPYAMPNVTVALSTASTVVPGPASAVSTRASSPAPTVVAVPNVVVEPPTSVAQRTSELLTAMGLNAHTPAFRSAGFAHVSDLRDKSSDGLRSIVPGLSVEDAEDLVVAVDDALRSSAKGKAPRAPFSQ